MPRVPLKVSMTNARSFYLASGKSKNEINRAFKEAGVEVGKLWAREFAIRHFDKGASARYKYPQRSFLWNEKKKRDRLYYDPKTEEYLPILKPQPWNLVCAGRIKDRVESGREGFAVHSTGKGNKANEQKIVVEVRIPLPHPIHPYYSAKNGSGDIVKLIRAESVEMGRLLMKVVMEKLGKIPPSQLRMKLTD